MGSRGYELNSVDGRRFAVPSPGVLLCPVRLADGNGFPTWLVEFTRGDILYFRRFGDDSAVYSLERLGDGALEFRDVDIDTLMYTMTPEYDEYDVFSGYAVEWSEHVSDDTPDRCEFEDGVVLPEDEDGETWSEFRADMGSLAFPVYSLVTESDAFSEDGGEEEVIRYEVVYFLDVRYEADGGSACNLWNYETGESEIEFRFGRGENDTRHRRVYSLDGPDGSVLFGDDGFVLYDGDGNRFGDGVVYSHEDDEGFDDGWGLDSLSGLALEDYLAAYSDDDRRSRSDELRTEVWNASLDAAPNPLDKILLMIRMFLDAELESAEKTWAIEIPANHRRVIEGTGAEIVATKDGWEIRNEEGGVEFTVSREDDSNGTTWSVHGVSGGAEYVVRPVGDGSFEVAGADGVVVHTVHTGESLEDFELNGEYSQENLYSVLTVRDADGNEEYVVDRPEKLDDPFDSISFAEFFDQPPLRKVDGAWITYADDPKYYEADSDNIDFWRDLYDRHNVLAYRIAKPSVWDEDDREVYSVDLTKVATLTISSLASDKTGEVVAKMYSDPEALFTYQLFDNGTGAYQYLTRYANDMVVVVNQKGNVVRYVTPSGELRGPTWHLFGYVGDGEVTDENGEVVYTFSRRSGDWNVYDAEGELVAHLFSATEPNNDWTIAEGHQRLFTFLATETTVLVDSDGSYVFRTKDGETEIESRVVVQANASGTLQLQILDEDGEEIYRVTPSGSSYQVNSANGVAFDTVNAYDTFSRGNMVLTRYWSVPYDRMMYSCTNDQEEGTFDDLDGTDQDGVPSPLSSGGSVAGGDVRGVSGSGVRVLGADDAPKTIAAESASSSSGDSSGSTMNDPDSIQDLIDTMSDFYDSVNGVLSKDTNTSKGDDLDPDNPLQISHTETDGRLIADAAFSNPSSIGMSEMHALQDAYDYTQAVTRISKMYSKGRADIYKEAQEYAETRTKRIEAKKAAFVNLMTRSKEAAERMKG